MVSLFLGVVNCSSCVAQVPVSDPTSPQTIDFPLDPAGVPGVSAVELSFVSSEPVQVLSSEILACHRPGTSRHYVIVHQHYLPTNLHTVCSVHCLNPK